MLGYFPTRKVSKVMEQGRAGHPSEKGSELGMHLCYSNFNISTAVTCCCMHDAASVIGTHTHTHIFVTTNMITKKSYPTSEKDDHNHWLSRIGVHTKMLSHVLHTPPLNNNNAGHQVSSMSYRLLSRWHASFRIKQSAGGCYYIYNININIMMMLQLLLLLMQR